MEAEESVENSKDDPVPNVAEISCDSGPSEALTLQEKIKTLEEDHRKMQAEFGQQRAKMKELYMQKEVECRRESEKCNQLKSEVQRLEVELGDAQSQLLAVNFQQESDLMAEQEKCQSEVASLQQLIQETVEESSSSRSKYEQEIRQLREQNDRLGSELQQLRSHQQEGSSVDNSSFSGVTEGGVAGVLTPLTAVTKSLARKVVSLAPSSSSSIIPAAAHLVGAPRASSPTSTEQSAENLDDCMRKAQEDAEVLRSLVVPLEQEIKALKDKLRSTDDQLQWYRTQTQKAPINFGVSASSDQLNIVQDSECRTTQGDISMMGASMSSLGSTTGEVQRSSARSSPVQFALPQESNEGPVPPSPGLRSVRSITPVPAVGCDMCANYETQLQRVQQRLGETERQQIRVQRAADRCREDLAKETEFRKEMENKWAESKEEHKIQVERLSKAVVESEAALSQLTQSFELTQVELSRELNLLSQQREDVQKRLNYLQSENEKLVGKHSATAAELQDESINLPDSVEELQELLLRTREELITATVGKESAEEQRDTLTNELAFVRHEMGSQIQTYTEENEELRKQLEDQKSLKKAEHALQITVAELKKDLAEAKRAKAQSERVELELRNRVASLQEDLDNNEATQQDFVQLSQSLQMELERLREAEKEVRWQHEDDVDECSGCKLPFSVTRRKKNCRHCGRIFCPACLPHQVASGPKQRPNKVCAVCHTLLVRDSAPYFSKRLPHTPD